MNTTHPESEIQQLRQELDALKNEFQELRQFLRVDPPAEAGRPPTLNLTCTTLSLCNPQGQQRGLLLAADTGACLSLYGNDLQERIFLAVENDATLLSFQNAAQETTLQLYAGAEAGRGEISVFEKGTPRAVVKAFDGGFGSVAVTNEDGTPSVGMCSLKTGGQLALMNMEKKIVVRLASDTGLAPEGGMIFVSRPDGQPVVGVNATASGGAVMVMDENDFSVAMMKGQHGGGIHINAADKKSSINLLAAENGHSGLTINDSENNPVAQLSGEGTRRRADHPGPAKLRARRHPSGGGRRAVFGIECRGRKKPAGDVDGVQGQGRAVSGKSPGRRRRIEHGGLWRQPDLPRKTR